MISRFTLLALATTILGSVNIFADDLTDNHANYLMSVQIHQLQPEFATGVQGLKNDISIGYYQFNGAGSVTHTRFDIHPSRSYYNTRISAKHVNTAISDLYPNEILGHPITQECEPSDMGWMFRPTMDYGSTNGTYTFDGTNLTISINGIQTTWRSVGSDRWELTQLDYNTQFPTRVRNFMGFAYFSESLGSYPISFKDHFDQGNFSNSASAYNGRVFVSSAADIPSSWPGYDNREFKFRGIDFSNQSYDGSATYANQYGFTWYYNLEDSSQLAMAQAQNGYQLDESKGAMVQNSLHTNYYASFPTLIFRNTGHIFHNFSKVGDESNDAFNSRRCWTTSDSIRTQGHIWLYLGAWDGEKVANMLVLEVSKNQSNYPLIAIGYAKGNWSN